MSSRTIFIVAGLLLFIAATGGAFGAHVLRPTLTPDQFYNFESALQYQFWHALGLLAVGIIAQSRRTALLSATAVMLVVGMLLFCGSIYAYTFGANRMIVMIAPIGGTALMIAWVLFVIDAWKSRQ